MKKAVQKGLTIIEGMIILAIVGILASVAIPVFQDYRTRVKVQKVVSLADPARTALGIACSEGKLSGVDNESIGLASADAYSGEYTRSIAVAGLSSTEGVVTITLASIDGVISDGQQIVYTGVCSADGMNWAISSDMAPKYWPKH